MLLMGDRNGEPWDRSVMELLNADFFMDRTEEPIRCSQGSLPSYRSYASWSLCLYNSMWSLLNRPDQGTSYFSQSTQSMMIPDQFLLSRGLLSDRHGWQVRCTEAGVPEVEIFLPDMMSTRKWRPPEFQRENHIGYSDHFPITTTLECPRRLRLRSASLFGARVSCCYGNSYWSEDRLSRRIQRRLRSRVEHSWTNVPFNCSPVAGG